MIAKRSRLPKPTDKRVTLRNAWSEDGRLGLEYIDHSGIGVMLLAIDQDGLAALAATLEQLQGKHKKERISDDTHRSPRPARQVQRR